MGAMLLSSFAGLRDHLERAGRRYELAPDGSELLRCRYIHDGAAIIVAMRPLRFANGHQWLGLGIALCPLDRVRPRGALVANAELPIGLLALWKEEIVLRQTLPFTALPVPVLEQALRALAATFLELTAALDSVSRDPGRETRFGYLFR